MAPLVTINDHTTASTPRPHVLYTVQVTADGKHTVVHRRYSEFAELHNVLGVKEYSLPPKRILATTFIPSAWVDDELIAERKAGLSEYLNNILRADDYRSSPALKEFLTLSTQRTDRPFDLEDALPSTLSRKTALEFQAKASGEPTTDEELNSADVEAKTSFIAAAYYPDWTVSSNPPEKLDYSKFDILFFAFATPNSSAKLNWDSGSQAVLKRLVSSAKSSGKKTKIVLSVGGWSGSYWFSKAVNSSANRATFTSALASAVSTYGLDGIDIDWEYPNSTGAGNPHSASDSANFLSLLKSLRTALGSSKIISAAVPQLPWLGSNGNPLTNVAAYAAQMTYVNIMNYDVWGASSTPGPNAPLSNHCGTSKQPRASAKAAFLQWTAAGFPASKLLLGLPLYGYVSQSTKTVLTGSLMPSSDMLLLESQEDSESADESKHEFLNGSHARNKPVETAEEEEHAQSIVQNEVQTTANLQKYYGQQVAFNTFVSSGALVKKNGVYVASGGFSRGWDNCSATPFLYNVSQKTVVTYDDTDSLGAKAAYAKTNGMAGCFTWSLDQDDGVTLQNAIRSKLGK